MIHAHLCLFTFHNCHTGVSSTQINTNNCSLDCFWSVRHLNNATVTILVVVFKMTTETCKKIFGSVEIVAHYVICVIFPSRIINHKETTAVGFSIYLSKKMKLYLRIVPPWNSSKSLMTKAIPAILNKKKSCISHDYVWSL